MRKLNKLAKPKKAIKRLPKTNPEKSDYLTLTIDVVRFAKERNIKFSQQDRTIISKVIKLKRNSNFMSKEEAQKFKLEIIDFLTRHQKNSESFEITHGKGPRH